MGHSGAGKTPNQSKLSTGQVRAREQEIKKHPAMGVLI